jgi:hypothetical protein
MTLGIGCLFLFLTFGAAAEDVRPPKISEPPLVSENKGAAAGRLSQNWKTCYVERCGISFSCSMDWKIRIIDENSTLITISDEPYVTLAISRVNAKVRLIEQLSDDFIESTGLYMTNFKKDWVKLAGKDAVELKAFSRFQPDMRYLGYFFIHDSNLTSVFFAVYPKRKWEEYQPIIKRIKDSFQRIE